MHIYDGNVVRGLIRFIARWITCMDRQAEPMGYHWATRHVSDQVHDDIPF